MDTKTNMTNLLRELAPYVILVGSFSRGEQRDNSDIDLYLRSRPVDEVDHELGAVHESYMPEALEIVNRYGLGFESVILGHIDIPRQPGIERMIEITTHYRIPHTNPIKIVNVYDVPLLAVADEKYASWEECYDYVDWDDSINDNVIRYPLPDYHKTVSEYSRL